MASFKKVCLLTGGTDGIGKEVCRLLLKNDHHVIILSRSQSQKSNTLQEFSTTRFDQIDLINCDLADQDSITSSIAQIKKKYSSIDLIINNAAVFSSHPVLTPQNVEQQLAVNYLAAFILSTRLKDLLKNSMDPRILNITSRAHRRGNLKLEDLNLKKKYNGLKAYNQSKLALILFTYEMADREPWLSINCMEPGLVATSIGLKHTSRVDKFLWSMMMLLGRKPAKAAEDIFFLATSEDVKNISGRYFSKRKICRSSEVTYDKTMAKLLWEKSEEMIAS